MILEGVAGGREGVFGLHRAPNAACADLPGALEFERGARRAPEL